VGYGEKGKKFVGKRVWNGYAAIRRRPHATGDYGGQEVAIGELLGGNTRQKKWPSPAYCRVLPGIVA
jgi:hypothetical protein